MANWACSLRDCSQAKAKMLILRVPRFEIVLLHFAARMCSNKFACLAAKFISLYSAYSALVYYLCIV